MVLIQRPCPNNRIIYLVEYSVLTRSARNEITNTKPYFFMSEAKLKCNALTRIESSVWLNIQFRLKMLGRRLQIQNHISG